jgi:hypothetical protein
MGAPKAKAAARMGADGFEKQQAIDHFTASPDACNKWLTIWRFTSGHLSHKGCEYSFKAHPEWRGV